MPPSWRIALADTPADHEAILALQRQNLPAAVAEEDRASQGFVTLAYTPALLDSVRGPYRHVIARVSDRIEAYALVMLRERGRQFPLLDPMFDTLDAYCARRDPALGLNYVVMGQVCVSHGLRGSGVFRALYEGLRAQLADDFDFLATEIAHENRRSVNAHAAIGFYPVNEGDGTPWQIVVWDWNAAPEGLRFGI